MDESPPSPPAPPDARPERDEELTVLVRIQADLADVDRALERLDDGSYGTCEVCGEALADEVLATAPATRLCAAHEAQPPAPAPAAPA